LMRRLLRSLNETQLKERGIEMLKNSGSRSPMVAASDAAGSIDRLERMELVRSTRDVGGALARVMAELDKARRLLAEVYGIGLWSKSDDASDNRRKREGLRETDWALSSALRELTDLRSHHPNIPASLGTLEDKLRALVGALEPLPDTVSDTMGESRRLDSTISEISSEISNLMEKASHLAAEYRGRSVEDGMSR